MTITRENKNLSVRIIIAILLGVLTGMAPEGIQAQFVSGSDESDGALTFDPGGGEDITVVFKPAEFNPPLDPDGDNVYHFTTVDIPPNVTVRLGADVMGPIPVVWLASGDVNIEGVVDLDGENGHAIAEPRVISIAGAGGFGGGLGGTEFNDPGPGLGSGGGGVGGPEPGDGGGAGHAFDGDGPLGFAYGNIFLLPMTGGSGGAGGAFDPGLNGGGGGAGGGSILIASSTTITTSPGGLITADGGNGGGGGFRGGGGSGGGIRLMANDIQIGGRLSARGGPAGGVNPGSEGRIRIESYERVITGTLHTTPYFGVPIQVFPPGNAPRIRVTQIAGVALPDTPTGSLTMPDSVIDEVNEVSVTVEARNIPVGTIVTLQIFPNLGDPITVETTPLAGTEEQSTAEAMVQFPRGFSRGYVQATWEP